MSKPSVSRAEPLYAQVRDLITERITSHVWQPGEMIPAELTLAKDLEVSPGTIRRAVNDLVADNILIRRQGKGTYIATQDGRRDKFHFFHFVGDDGSKVLPTSLTHSCELKKASAFEQSILALEASTFVINIRRTRYLTDTPTICESIVLPAEYFSGLADTDPAALPNSLYSLYEEKYSVTIHHADEQLRATTASATDVRNLGIAPNSPLLEITRIASTLEGVPVELRVSRCHTASHYYQNTVF